MQTQHIMHMFLSCRPAACALSLMRWNAWHEAYACLQLTGHARQMRHWHADSRL